MRRFSFVVMVVLIMTAMMVASAGSAFASANNPNGSKGSGQEQATSNCNGNVGKQGTNGVKAGGGPKEGVLGPTNCDHLHQNNGSIGR